MNNKRGIGFLGLLQICFIVLKLCGVIQWSWVWVLAPLWISFVLITIASVVVVIWVDVINGDRPKRF